MKKLLLVLLCGLTLVGCSAKGYDYNKFAEEMKNTSEANVRVYTTYTNEEGTLIELDEHLDGKVDLKNKINDMITNANLEKAESQEKVYGTPVFFVDLNKILDENYRRFLVYSDVVVVQTTDEFINYNITDDLKSNIKKLTPELVEAFQTSAE